MEVPSQYRNPDTDELELERFEDEAYDKHHAMFTRTAQKKNADTALLRKRLVVPMFISDHKELHANVEPPIVPSRGLARAAFDLILISEEQDPLGKLDDVIDGLLLIAQKDMTRMGDEAWILHENLEKQRQFMNRTHFIGEVLQLNNEHKECE